MKRTYLALLFFFSVVQSPLAGSGKEISILGWQQQIIQRAVIEFEEQTGEFPKNHRIILYQKGEIFLVSLLGVHRNPNASGNSSNSRVPEMDIEIDTDLNILSSNFVR